MNYAPSGFLMHQSELANGPLMVPLGRTKERLRQLYFDDDAPAFLWIHTHKLHELVVRDLPGRGLVAFHIISLLLKCEHSFARRMGLIWIFEPINSTIYWPSRGPMAALELLGVTGLPRDD